MERHANYALIGGATIVGVVLAFLFALFIAGTSINAEYNVYDVVFHGPARGIGAGTEVRFNGIRVGEVQKLFMPPGKEDTVVARIRIGSSWPVRADSDARLEPIGLTGQNLIQITPGDPKSALLARRLGAAPPQIPARQGAIDEILANSEDIARNASEALAGARDILSKENADRLDRILINLERVSDQLSAQRGAVASVAVAAQQVGDAARRFGDAAEEVQGLSADARGTLASFDARATKALDSVQAAAADINDAAKSVQSASGEAAYSTLPELSQTTASLRKLANSLDRVASGVERSAAYRTLGEQKPMAKVQP